MTRPQDQSWNEAQLGSQQGRQKQPQQSQPQQSQSQQGQSQQGQSQQGRSQPQQGQQGSAGGQQHQFDPQGGGQQGGGGSHGNFADQIQPHAEVIDDAGNHVGTVDHVQGGQIKLSRSDSADGEHHYISLSQVAGIEGGRVRLRERGDNDFGMSTD